mmetsp:Transcript_57830/g.172647  ORF Transcript_57830/g.172647 Transcript_57830/m.172647 type:complete len:239 (+) Transcript_57830:393-1109(+)
MRPFRFVQHRRREGLSEGGRSYSERVRRRDSDREGGVRGRDYRRGNRRRVEGQDSERRADGRSLRHVGLGRRSLPLFCFPGRRPPPPRRGPRLPRLLRRRPHHLLRVPRPHDRYRCSLHGPGVDVGHEGRVPLRYDQGIRAARRIDAGVLLHCAGGRGERRALQRAGVAVGREGRIPRRHDVGVDQKRGTSHLRLSAGCFRRQCRSVHSPGVVLGRPGRISGRHVLRAEQERGASRCG